MSRQALSGDHDMPIAEAARLMVEQARKILCVVDAEGHFLGIVDRADVLRAVSEAVAPLAPSCWSRSTQASRCER